MFFDTSYQVTSQFSEHTHDFLSSHSIKPTPVNYFVIYLYICNDNKLLTIEIDKQLKEKKAISTDFITDLFKRFISDTQQVDSSILAPFEDAMSKTLQKLAAQVSNENKTEKSLQKLDKILTDANQKTSSESVVNYLLSTINTAKTQHQAMSQELISTQQKMNQLKDKLASSREEALIDSLTGLLNRRGCDEKLKKFDFKKNHSSLAIDIDHFKKVNDTFGHFIGDKVIQCIAKTIQNHISEQDLAVRFGGEEFVVVIANKPIKQAHVIAEKIRNSVEKMRLKQKESNTYLPPISISIGIAQNNKSTNWTTLFEQADNALYQAKNAGRNRCICA